MITQKRCLGGLSFLSHPRNALLSPICSTVTSLKSYRAKRLARKRITDRRFGSFVRSSETWRLRKWHHNISWPMSMRGELRRERTERLRCLATLSTKRVYGGSMTGRTLVAYPEFEIAKRREIATSLTKKSRNLRRLHRNG